MPNHSRGLYPTSNMKVDFLGGKQRENVGTLWENTQTMCTTTYLLYISYVGAIVGNVYERIARVPKGTHVFPFEGR